MKLTFNKGRKALSGAYKTKHLLYGILMTNNEGVWTKTYCIEVYNLTRLNLTLYGSTSKPRLPFWVYRSITFLLLLAELIPFSFVLLYFLIFGFIHQCLFRESFITSGFERFSGWLWLILGLIGIGTIVNLFI